MIFKDAAVFYVKINDYNIHFYYMTKHEAINIMKQSDLKEKVDHCKNTEFFFLSGFCFTNINESHDSNRRGRAFH